MEGDPKPPDLAASAARDVALMERLARGDRDALADLIGRHQQRIWAVAYRFTHRREDAEDVTQEAFLRLWRAAPAWRPTASLTTWLYRITANLCLDLQRKNARGPKPLWALCTEPAVVEERTLEADETAHLVQRAVAALPERQRMALVLHRFEGLSYHEIADVTGWGEAAIESLLSRAYAALRIQLNELRPVQ